MHVEFKQVTAVKQRFMRRDIQGLPKPTPKQQPSNMTYSLCRAQERIEMLLSTKHA